MRPTTETSARSTPPVFAAVTTKRGWVPARVWEFWAPNGHRGNRSVHLTWALLDGLANAALVLDDPKLLDVCTEIWESVTRFHQWNSKRGRAHPSRAGTFSPISARLVNFPGSESKILGNIGRFGMSYLAVKRLMRL